MELQFIRDMGGYVFYLKKEEAKVSNCTKCFQKVETGYYCDTYNVLICKDCHKDWDFKRCKYNKEGQHEHTHIAEIRIVD